MCMHMLAFCLNISVSLKIFYSFNFKNISESIRATKVAKTQGATYLETVRSHVFGNCFLPSENFLSCSTVECLSKKLQPGACSSLTTLCERQVRMHCNQGNQDINEAKFLEIKENIKK